MANIDDIVARVSALVVRFKPGARVTSVARAQHLVHELGYDSVRLVELLFACGESFAVELPLERMLEQGDLTPEVIAGHIVMVLKEHR